MAITDTLPKFDPYARGVLAPVIPEKEKAPVLTPEQQAELAKRTAGVSPTITPTAGQLSEIDRLRVGKLPAGQSYTGVTASLPFLGGFGAEAPISAAPPVAPAPVPPPIEEQGTSGISGPPRSTAMQAVPQLENIGGYVRNEQTGVTQYLPSATPSATTNTVAPARGYMSPGAPSPVIPIEASTAPKGIAQNIWDQAVAYANKGGTSEAQGARLQLALHGLTQASEAETAKTHAETVRAAGLTTPHVIAQEEEYDPITKMLVRNKNIYGQYNPATRGYEPIKLPEMAPTKIPTKPLTAFSK